MHPALPAPGGPAAPDNYAPDRSVSVDVAVAGAGVIGLAVAWRLRLAGFRVALVDPAPAMGASRAAAGMLAPAGEVQYQQEALFPLMRAAAGEYPEFAASVERASGLPSGYRATETLACAADAADRRALEDLRGLQEGHGMAVEPLPLRAARRMEPALSPRLAGVFRIPGDHQVDPRMLAAALLGALGCRDAGPWGTPGADDGGPALVLRDRAEALHRTADGAVAGLVLAGGTTVRAGWTVLATGAGPEPANLPPGLSLPPVRPVFGDILRARVRPGAPPLLERTVRGLVHGLPVYLVPRADGSLVIGATSREDNRPGVDVGGVFALLRDARALVPAVDDLELVETMARARPGTPDDLPCLGIPRTDDGRPVAGLVLATGFFRHGVLLAPLAARLTAGLIAGTSGADPADAAYLAAAAPDRFRSVPTHL